MSSYANIEAFVTKHLTIDLSADFDEKTLSGTVALDFERRDPHATEVVLDTRDLQIQMAEAAAPAGEWLKTSFQLDPPTTALGSALRVKVPADCSRVRVTYSTSPGAKGLQWLTPAQTAGKKHPFLFSQAQAIQARSFIPLQDTPAVRATYDATLSVPKSLVAVMAAERKEENSGDGVFRFHMPQPIPSYLIALAIGDLTFKSMSQRTGVWAEPSVVDSAAREFEDTEQMIKTTESLYGPYRWGRYDLLVLPPSFPFGGMENPRLTFATPTVIVGDKSLVSLVAHELAHSWSGNLVTNATWRDFWLNEGFTVYLERRIVEVVYNRRLADMERVLGLRELADARANLEVPGDRTLLPNIGTRDPDEFYSYVPYEQGSLFLTFIESKFGRDAFDQFLRRWFDEHAFQSVTTEQFLAFLHANLLSTKPGAVTEAQIQEWLHTETIPAFAVMPTSDALTKVEQAQHVSPAWSTQEHVHFIDSLPRDIGVDRMRTLDQKSNLTDSPNAEIAFAWYRLVVANNYTDAFPAMERFMIRIGRRKFIVPLYRDLVKTAEGKTLAKSIYAKAREGYHPLAQATIDELVLGK
jgi:leukotriene-A4 hydrolase